MIEAFLTAIWGQLGEGAFGEVRVLGEGGHASSAFFESIDRVADYARAMDTLGDVYYGVLPRTRRSGTAADCPSDAHVLWADIDAKGRDKWSLLQALRDEGKLRLIPSIIVDSGHGLHAYWLLRKPVPFIDAHHAMRWLAREAQGDAVYDAPRILRLPETTNHKSEPFMPVRILYWDIDRKYRIADFQRVEEKHTTLPLRIRSGEPPSWLAELIREGAPRGQRSEACFRAVIWMLRYGWTDDEIAAAFEYNPQGIGEKYHELRGGGMRWLTRTIQAARAAGD